MNNMFIGKIKVLECDIPNRNGVTFSKEAIEKAIENISEKIKNNQMVGMPFDVNNNIKFPDLRKVSHKINNLYFEDNLLYADIDILSTSNGILMTELINFDMKAIPILTGTINDKNRVENVELHRIDLDINHPIKENK